MSLSHEHPYAVLLYYKFIDIADPHTVVYDHLTVCKNLNLLGRIYISEEGINGTCSGKIEDLEKYLKYMKKHPLFEDIKFKIDYTDNHAFRKIFVRYRPEIVASDLFDAIHPREGGKHLSPAQWQEMAKNDPDAVMFDARNNYESVIGTFEGAVLPNTERFRDLKDMVEEGKFDDLKDKKLMMFCTGGIRCEKISAYFKKKGFQNVYQLDGGIVSYAKKIPEEERLFKGKCFVFDDRIAVPITKDVLSECYHCGEACDRYLNCTNAECNELFLCCDDCEVILGHACSESCAAQPRAEWKRKDLVG